MPKYKYQGKFKCEACGKKFTKNGTCCPKFCPSCGGDKALLKLISQSRLASD